MVISDSGRFELSQIPVRDRTSFTRDLVTAPVQNESDQSVTFALIRKLYPAGQRRSFSDARGYVINDYQQLLEENWIRELRKKYPVVLNEAVLKETIDDPAIRQVPSLHSR